MATDTVRQVPSTGWRAKAAAMLVEVRQLIDGAKRASEAGGESYLLLEHADGFADTMEQAVSLETSDESETASLLLGDVYDLSALLAGAAAVDGATMAAKRLISDAMGLCDAASEYLDCGGEGGGSNSPEMRISAEEGGGAAELEQARELVDFLVTEVQELYMHTPSASAVENTLANALLSGIGYAIDRAASEVEARDLGIGEALALLGSLEDMLPNGEKPRALWQRTTGLISGLRVVLGRPLEGDAEAAQAGGSVQPLRDAAKAAPAPVPQAAGASPGDPTRSPGGNVLDTERDERAGICCKAAGEIYSLAALVHNQIAEDSGGVALRSMLRRVQTLSNCILSAVDDEVDTVEQIRERLEAI